MNAKLANTNSLKRNNYYISDKYDRRGVHSNMNYDNYSLYFWDMLHSDSLFAALNKINDFVRKLYALLKLLVR